jgi:hypothetical protein
MPFPFGCLTKDAHASNTRTPPHAGSAPGDFDAGERQLSQLTGGKRITSQLTITAGILAAKVRNGSHPRFG